MADEMKIESHAAAAPETDMEMGKVALSKDELHLASLGYKQGERMLNNKSSPTSLTSNLKNFIGSTEIPQPIAISADS